MERLSTAIMAASKNIADWTWGDTWVLVATGMFVVFLVLLMLILLVTLMGRIMQGTNRKDTKSKPVPDAVQKVPAPLAQPAAPAVQRVEDGIEEETVAVISAAIACMMEEKGVSSFRLKSISRSKKSRSVWGMAGISENTRPF